MLSAEQARKIRKTQLEELVDGYMQELANEIVGASKQLLNSTDYRLPENELVQEIVLSRLDELGYAVVIDDVRFTIEW